LTQQTSRYSGFFIEAIRLLYIVQKLLQVMQAKFVCIPKGCKEFIKQKKKQKICQSPWIRSTEEWLLLPCGKVAIPLPFWSPSSHFLSLCYGNSPSLLIVIPLYFEFLFKRSLDVTCLWMDLFGQIEAT